MFAARDIACRAIGTCNASLRLTLSARGETATVWDLSETGLTGCGSA